MTTRFCHFASLGLTSLALAMPLAVNADESGFFDGAKGQLTARNFYINRNFVDADFPQSKAEEWTQSFLLNLQSGYTDGAVGLGVDLLGLMSFKLDGGGGTGGTHLLPLDDGRPVDNFGRLAGALKAKVSATELRLGEMVPVLPILRSDDGRSLPQSFRGAMLSSKEWSGLTLQAGQMRQGSLRNSASMDDMGAFGAFSDRFNYAGGEYRFNTDRTQVGVWHAQLENIYRQQYLNLMHSQPVGDWTLGANLGYFTGREDGSAKAGDLDNRTYSGMFSARYGYHTAYIGLQRVNGDSAWMRVAGTSGGTLANDSYNASFDNPNERSAQLRYDYNFAGLGLPGLTSMVRYIKGDKVRTALVDDGKEWIRDAELAYVVQSGPLKDLSLRWRHSSVRRDFSSNEFDEHRLIVSYTFTLF